MVKRRHTQAPPPRRPDTDNVDTLASGLVLPRGTVTGGHALPVIGASMSLTDMVDSFWGSLKDLARYDRGMEFVDKAETAKFPGRYDTIKSNVESAADMDAKKSLIYKTFFADRLMFPKGADENYIRFNIEQLYFSGDKGQEDLRNLEKAITEGNPVRMAFYMQEAEARYHLNVHLSTVSQKVMANAKSNKELMSLLSKKLAEAIGGEDITVEEVTGNFWQYYNGYRQSRQDAGRAKMLRQV